jgi:hypothetical protein
MRRTAVSPAPQAAVRLRLSHALASALLALLLTSAPAVGQGPPPDPPADPPADPPPGSAAGPAGVPLPDLGDEDVPRRPALAPPPPSAAASAPSSSPAAGPGEPGEQAGQADPQAAFGDVVNVVNATFVVRVLADDGSPVLGLGGDSFVAVDETGERLPVVAVEWVASGEAVESWEAQSRDQVGPPPDVGLHAAGPTSPRLAELPGKLVVVFVQADFNGPRIYGHLKMLPNVARLLYTLAPRDRVAVVSFDSHMELWQDFTTDREAARYAVWRAVHFGADPPAGRPRSRPRGPSLAAHLDEAEMAGAAYAENALELLGNALQAFPDDKVVLYVGFGLGRYGFGGFQMRPNDYPQAREALRRSNASVFVLDVMDAASHTLEIGLQQVAADTGGLYVRTATNPMQAFRRMAQALSGYYVVTVDASGRERKKVELSLDGVGRGTRLLVRSLERGG